ncbi:hypothetical protein EMIHUDRAFT_73582 [Emiliania huxleyi CCMP1516]|uniref:Ribokinase n=2 Tax=Emiliania huxleyi TaxID=2903 RepID=A0A0D3JS33_EMIH1|nr:hypothetical protein EMIHUDRAFT_73582 [Emiliania huxleyi CCMP1516]EOD26318.1 hypothetical protein EMIHUDRAFT_73582 [Emiliania huxleyi CCMP1516]|eukprot:XP_005778747.1 hypothetical protein EMIHUDRAFT_73582 [Emiliania huxleyi CCMP1516]
MGVVVVGSANVDLVTNAPRFAEPGETLMATQFEQLFGGKGANQAVAASLLGSSVFMVAKLGTDSLGEASIANFHSLGVDTSHVTTTGAAASGVAQITVAASGQNQILIVPGANGELCAADIDAAAPAFAASRVLLTQLEVPVPATLAALKAGRAAGLTTVFNSAPAPTEPLPDELYPLCDVVCPNETETALLTGETALARSMPTDTIEECEAAARAILAKGSGAVVMTLGGRGRRCMLVLPGQPATHVQVPPHLRAESVADTTGAGDGFLGALAHLMASCGKPLAEALPGAVHVASISVQRRGAQSSYPLAAELPPDIFGVEAGDGEPKAAPAPLAKQQAEAAPRRSHHRSRLAAAAGWHAVDTLVTSGMVLGVGTGGAA